MSIPLGVTDPGDPLTPVRVSLDFILLGTSDATFKRNKAVIHDPDSPSCPVAIYLIPEAVRHFLHPQLT